MTDIEERSNNVILNGISVEYNCEKNELILKNNNASPLTIRFEGQLNIRFNDDFTLESTGQIDLISRQNMICLDSVDSSIHLNSRKSKNLWNDEEEKKFLRIKDEQERAIKRMRIKEKNQMSDLEKLQQLCDNINRRVLEIEQREQNLIELNPGGHNNE